MDSHVVSRHGLDEEEEKLTLLGTSSPGAESDAHRLDFFSHLHVLRRRLTRPRAATSIVPLLRQTGLFFLPSFIQPLLTTTPSTHRQHPDLSTATHSPPLPGPPHTRLPTPTSYLDGIRGLAALAVFLCHYLYAAFVIAPGYGTAGANHHLFKLPFLRLLFSGPPMVCVFFVVSGYALALRPARLLLRMAQARDGSSAAARLLAAVASLAFRRGIRLFAPPAASTALIALLVWAGAYERTRDVAGDPRLLRNAREPHYGPPLGSLGAQAADWARQLFGFVHVWDWAPFGGSTAMDVHLWTIPVEFRCSMVLFLTLVGTARLKRWVRMVVVAGLVVFSYLSQRWEMVLFYAGMVMAEVDVWSGAHGSYGAGGALPAPGRKSGEPVGRASSPSPPLARRRMAQRAFWNALSVVGLFLMSQPDVGGAETPGWVWLTSLIPDWWQDEHRYWQSAGAILFVLAVGRSRGWQRFFNLGVVQYFGRISFAIYLMHGPVLHTFGYAIERLAWGLTGVEGSAYAWGFALAAVFVVPIVVWVSDVFWRAVDAPVVRFAKWFEKQCSIPE